MPDFEKLYHDLFNAITDALNAIEEKILLAKAMLIRAQQAAEEAYLAAGE